MSVLDTAALAFQATIRQKKMWIGLCDYCGSDGIQKVIRVMRTGPDGDDKEFVCYDCMPSY